MKKNLLVIAMVMTLLMGCGTGGAATPTTVPPTPLATDGGAAPTTTADPAVATPLATDPPTVEQATPAPGTAPAGVLIQAPDQSLVVIDPATGQAAPFTNPGMLIFPGATGTSVDAVQGKVYVVSEQQVHEITPAGARLLTDYGNGVMGIAVQPVDGAPDHPMIAFGSLDLNGDVPNARLMIVPVDGLDAVLVAEQATPEAFYLVPLRWSADGQQLYYTEEPTGLGGYIPFGGFSSLYVYNLGDNTSSVIIPQDILGEGAFICLDDLSPDASLVAHHCGNEGIGILDIATGQQTALITPPAEVTGWTLTGSARFSPSGQKIAFAAAAGDPEAEQGWVMVADTLTGPARLVATSAPTDYYTITGWFDENTLILQSYAGSPAVWLLRLDGSAPVKLVDGFYLDTMQ